MLRALWSHIVDHASISRRPLSCDYSLSFLGMNVNCSVLQLMSKRRPISSATTNYQGKKMDISSNSTHSVDFQRVTVGDLKVRMVDLVNIRSTTIVLVATGNESSSESGFSLPNALRLMPRERRTVQVTFEPHSAGSIEEQVVMKSPDGQLVLTLNLRGTGVVEFRSPTLSRTRSLRTGSLSKQLDEANFQIKDVIARHEEERNFERKAFNDKLTDVQSELFKSKAETAALRSRLTSKGEEMLVLEVQLQQKSQVIEKLRETVSNFEKIVAVDSEARMKQQQRILEQRRCTYEVLNYLDDLLLRVMNKAPEVLEIEHYSTRRL